MTIQARATDNDPRRSELAGLEVSAACFVRDYVELHFDGPVLRMLAAPIVRAEDGCWGFPGAGSRDALCRLVGSRVVSASDEPERLVLRFTGGVVLHVPKASPGAGPEIAQFVPIHAGRPDAASMMTWENLIPTRED